MKVLTRLAFGGLDGFSFSRSGWQRSVGPRSIHLVPGCGRPSPTEATNPDPPAPAAAGKDPRWVLLDSRGVRWNDSLVADADAAAECRTSTGQRLRVAFDLAAPPARSLLYYDSVETAAPGEEKHARPLTVVAAHGDSVLLRMARRWRCEPSSSTAADRFDHFVYRPGGGSGGGGRPPSLSLLPALKVRMRYDEATAEPTCRPLLVDDTGILRRGGDGEFLVAWIEVLSEHCGGHATANLSVLRPGSSQWEHKRLVPVAHEEGDEVMGPLTGPDVAITVGDRFLCWLGSIHCFILCDMADAARPRLRHVPLPGPPYDPYYYTDDLPPLTDSYTLGAGAAAGAAVRYVSIDPRCCCGGFGRTSCPRCRHAFTVTTWTLALSVDEPVAWVKNGVMDCEELWAMPGYEGIPRVHLQCPVVSAEKPDVVFFKVVSFADRKRETWMIEVDMRRKAILAAVQCTDPGRSYDGSRHGLQAKLRW